MTNNFSIQNKDPFSVVSKTKIDGQEFDVLANGMKVSAGSIFNAETDQKGITTLNLSDNSIFKGTTGQDKNLIIKTNHSDLDFLGGGDDVTVEGNENKLKEVNGANTSAENAIAVKGNDNNFFGGTNTKLTLDGNDNNAVSENIHSIGSKNSLSAHDINSEGMNNILTLKGSGASAEVSGNGNHVYNPGSGKNKNITFNDPGNFLNSKSFYANYQEKYDKGDDDTIKVTDGNGKEIKGVSSLEQDHVNVSNVSPVSKDPNTGETIVLENKMPKVEKLVNNATSDLTK